MGGIQTETENQVEREKHKEKRLNEKDKTSQLLSGAISGDRRTEDMEKESGGGQIEQ